jgi:release factor glutamine methyltransferase
MAKPEEAWTIARLIDWTRGHFEKKGMDSPRLDAELLLAHVLGKDRVYLYTHYDQPLTPSERDTFRVLVQRRARYEPVAYILGEREFYGRAFTVNRDVLVPRPETEHLVDAVREWIDAHALATPRIADIGTGSGAIAVSLAAGYPGAHVVASDVSEPALAVAKINAVRHDVASRVELVVGDALAPLEARGPFDVIAGNPPYIPTEDRARLMADVRDHEPAVALFGGPDGLTILRRIISGAPALLASPGLLTLEMGAEQGDDVRRLAEAAGAFSKVRILPDLAGRDRLLVAERT